MFNKPLELKVNEVNHSNYPAIVVGSGIAGLYTAIKIAEAGIKIALITKSKLGESNTRYAQGGVAAVLPQNTNDSIDLHVKDTLEAGAGLSDPEVTRFISKNGASVINDLIRFGVKFDKDNQDNLAITLEGAHSVRRVLHAGGDATGRNIEQALVALIEKIPTIDTFEEYQVVELLKDKTNTCKGVIIFDNNTFEHKIFTSEATILATGGLSQVYLNTTNPEVATGDGIAISYNAGATIQDMEFIQFHPTAFHTDATPKFLISESVRGEGAKLRNVNGELFAHKYHKQSDLAPRDIVTRAIFSEMTKTSSDFVYLDATHIPLETLTKRFPNIIKECKSTGIDISKDYIPVSPAAHYSMGGISVNTHGQTTINNLYAVGEACCTSLHGANRLASNSLLECVVIADEVVKDLLQNMNLNNASCQLSDLFADEHVYSLTSNYFNNIKDSTYTKVEEKIVFLKTTMWKNAGVKRTRKTLDICLSDIEKIKKDFNKTSRCNTLKEYELRNLLVVAELIAQSALGRKESRGAHYREDFPQVCKVANHSFITIDEINNEQQFHTSQTNFKQLCSVCS